MGIDLFNRAFLWEAHEVWEQVWIGSGKTTIPANHVQGLIQISAALLRSHLGTPQGALNLFEKAGRRFDVIEAQLGDAGATTYMGIEVGPWQVAVSRYLMQDGAPFPFLSPEL